MVMATTKKSSSRKTKNPRTTAKTPDKKTLLKFRKPSLNAGAFRQYLTPFLVLLIVALLGIFWYYKIYTDPQRIFWGMVSNNLSTNSFSKVSSQESGSYSGKEVTQVIFQPELAVHNVRDITDNTQAQPTHIKLESIGTPDTDYQHYLLIDRPAAEGGAKPDYSKVYDLWLKSEDQGAQLINSNLFGPLLFGHLPQPIKETIIKDLRQAYKVDYKNVKKLNMDGRRTYIFNVEVSLAEYAAAAQKYARALGLAVADQINPSDYSEAAKTSITLYVDALSRQIRKVEYQAGNNFESYTAYGIKKEIKPPKKTVSPEEFQKAINSVSE